MSKKDEALKLALEALEVCQQSNYGRDWVWPDTAHPTAMANVKEAITAIRSALAEQPAQQEPVAWYHAEDYKTHFTSILSKDLIEIGYWKPLYTSPPASKPWVWLTEKEHTDIAIQCGCMSADWVFYGATVERILKEKNS